MRPRSRAGNLVKVRRRKSVTRRRPNASNSARSRTSSVDGLKSTVARLTRELNEALDQQRASSDVLRIISSLPGELQPVFEAILQNAVRICGANFGNIYHWDGDALHLVAAPRHLLLSKRGGVHCSVPVRQLRSVAWLQVILAAWAAKF
jgi:hypothetical protein